MNNSSMISLEASKVHKTSNQMGLLSTAISKLGDSSFIAKSKQTTTNASPVRMRLFRDSPNKVKGLEGFAVGEYHPKKASQVVYSSIYRSSSPIQRSARAFHESPQRAKQRLERFKLWDSKLDIQLQLQNNQISKLNDMNHQPLTYVKSSVQLGDRLNRITTPSVPQSEIVQLTAKLNAIPRSEIGSFSRGHAHELQSLQQTLNRLMKTNKGY